MAATFKRGDRVRVKGGTRAGITGRIDRAHGGKGFAGYWCIWPDGTAFDATGFAAPAENLELIA
jgi:uncharacterized protein YodC (DUF2158 family)